MNHPRRCLSLVAFVAASCVGSRAFAQPVEPASAAPAAAPAAAAPAAAAPAAAAPAAADAPQPSRAQQLRRLADQLAAQQARLDEQQATIRRLEEKMQAREPVAPALKPAPSGDDAAAADAASRIDPASASDGYETTEDPRKRTLVYGYLQGQFQIDQSSQSVVAQGGRSLNQDRFLVPRARVVVEREWAIAGALLELDGNTVNGPSFGVQRAEASILYRGGNAPPSPPMLAVTLGQFRVPFGAENLQSPSVRYFMERSLVSRAMFPSEIDLGLRVAGAVAWFRYSLSATNGQPLGTQPFPLGDPDAAKDVAGRLGVAVKPLAWIDLDAGVSSLVGRGFHQESGGVKSQLQWIDRNGDGILQPDEITGVAAVAARPSTTFRRFALGFDAAVNLRWRFGETLFAGSLVLGNNMDRGLFPSDPTLLGRDTRHLGYVLSVVHELGDWVVLGLRTDYYDPDSDSSDYQNARPVQPNDRSIRTWSPLVGLRYQRRARLLFQYDVVRDKLGRDEAGRPADLANDRMSVRLQVSL